MRFDIRPAFTTLLLLISLLAGGKSLASDKNTSRRAQKSPAMKMSAALELGATGNPFLVVFYEDVARGDAELAVTRAGLKRVEHPDLLPNHVIAEGTREQAELLARQPDVAYILPASEELISGAPVAGCLGPMSTAQQVANFVATVGQGWEGSGPGSADLTYSFGRMTEKMPRTVVIASIQQALAEWARHAQIRFSYSDTPGQKQDLNFVFATGDHGDPYLFDGPGRVLAHTFFPALVNPEPIAGDLHFDDDESWYNGGGTDFYSVVLHEIGHALGLGHSDRPTAVMYPYYRRMATLQADDISALHRLYAARAPESDTEAQVEPAPLPPSLPAPNPAPTTPTLPQPDNSEPSSDKVAPSLTISSPGMAISSTSAAAVRITGVASDNKGVVEVSWSASGGRSGVAAGTANWEIAEVPLRIGDNRITVRALDAAGNSRAKTITVVRR